MKQPPSLNTGVRVGRVYDDTARNGEYLVLVDRLWPRGVSKSDAAWDEWLKDVAPSTELRRWYDHDVDRFAEFARRYHAMLGEPPASAAVDRIHELAQTNVVVLLTATRDVEHSGARVLQDHLAHRGDDHGATGGAVLSPPKGAAR
ncbi:MAG: DUF488 domain-containing protein [Ilumatobacteraceae bacterium]